MWIHQNNRLGFLGAIKSIDQVIGKQYQHDAAENTERQRQQSGWQWPQTDTVGLKKPRDQNGHRCTKGHGVAVGKIGKPQNTVNERHTQSPKCQLTAIGHAGNNYVIAQGYNCIQKIH